MSASKTIGGTKKQTGLLIGPTHDAGLATIPSSSLRVGSVCLWDRDQTGETRCCIVEVTSKDILDQNAHFLCEGRVQDVLPTAQRYDVAVSVKNICESETFMGSKSSSTTVPTNWVISASNIFEPVLRQGPSDRDKRALSSLASGAAVVLIWKTTRVYPARCGVCIEVGPSPSRLSSEHQCLTRSC